MTALVWAANILGWPLIQLGLAAAFLRLPTRLFAQDCWLTKTRAFERDGRLYRDGLHIRRWKRLLPDGAGWLGGFPKNAAPSRDPAYLARFAEETRRAEVAHWCMLLCLPVFFLWNPPWARWVMTAYALAANLPCIAAQRYNRMALGRLITLRQKRSVAA